MDGGRDGAGYECQVLYTVWGLFQNTGVSINVIAITLTVNSKTQYRQQITNG